MPDRTEFPGTPHALSWPAWLGVGCGIGSVLAYLGDPVLGLAMFVLAAIGMFVTLVLIRDWRKPMSPRAAVVNKIAVAG